MTGPAEPSTDAATIYDAFAQKYRSYSETKSDYLSAVDRLVCEQLNGRAGVVLDYGAGDGVRGANLCEQIAPDAFYQADVSNEMIARCRSLGLAKQVFQVQDPDWSKDLPPLDTVMCLWNVLGHLPDTQSRRALLSELHALLRPGGTLIIDVNNRHYVGYGAFKTVWRRIIDAVKPDYARGDIRFNWAIDGVDFPASGHFFTPAEMRDLLQTAGLTIIKAVAVHYATGDVSENLTRGQLFFAATKSS
ncbi:methyltransferase domain-containing protein [uncultured Roseobacter sp.]|uniref:class I SAM-dependent methyltransferase n=1 Tax=uncultured Roseobacter sp. TaxID=114847 RepID=UPI0026110F75|nr:methyltransferase domain-containing protein [uncultured Roseobacter sp.]